MSNSVTVLRKGLIWLFSVGLLCLLAVGGLQAQTTINHDISTGDLVIQGTSIDNYFVTGSTTTNRIIVGSGYAGTITLSNVSIVSNGTATFSAACGNGTNVVTTGSCMAIMGKNRILVTDPAPNLSPVTRVNLILDGNNSLLNTSNLAYCAIQVDEGAQIHINAIDLNNNSSGILVAKSTTQPPGGTASQGGAAIGAIHGQGTHVTTMYNGNQGISVITGGSCVTPRPTTGGNVLIGSGIITAWGGHGAGIGGGFRSYYNGIIIIYGGIVESRGGYDAAGIGSGCPEGSGVLACYADMSTLVGLPPALIEAYGAGGTPNGGVGSTQFSELGLTGAKNITYINDPNKTLITVLTQDSLPNANIYLDLTQTPNLVNVFNSVGLGWYDLTKVRVGRTDPVTGMFSFRAELQQNTTFFTDASSINPAMLGRPYLSVIKTVTGNVTNRDTVILPLLPANISFTDYPSTPLKVGYTSTQAVENAYCIKVNYNDVISMTNVSYVLQYGIDFSSLIFLDYDSITPISPPATLTDGTVFYILFPIDLGKPLGVYSDVLLIHGDYGGIPLSGYIRKIGMQRVVFDDSYDNDYIRVTASPDQFITTYPTANTVTLTLNIDHTGTSVLYDPLDVVAMYLVTTEPDYNLAIAADPLYSSAWNTLNIPAVNNGNANTTVSFSTMPQGAYYIHWYVESGEVYAHSLTVINPPALYGGFGQYGIFDTVVPGTITGASQVCHGKTPTLTGTASIGGSGNYIYTWQTSSSASGPWINLPSSNSQNYTTGILTSTAYYRRETVDATMGTSYSNIIQIVVMPPVIPSITITAKPN